MSLRGIPRVAVVLSHPNQYYSPWFRHVSEHGGIDLTVYYLWDFGVRPSYDRDFDQDIQWDIPLLDGHRSVFVPNRSRDPGTHRFSGLDNPGLVDALDQARPDAIVLFGYAYLSHLRVLLSPRLARIPMLLRGDSHDLARSGGWKGHAARALRKLLFRRFSAVLAVGHANAGYFRNCAVPAARIHRVPHCVDNARFRAAASQARSQSAAWLETMGVPDSAFTIVFAGKLEPKKRPLDLLAAFIRVQQSRSNSADEPLALLLVGSGVLEDQLRAMAGDRIGRSVFFVPFQNQSQMPRVYASADVFVLPSCGEGETWGLAINEAMNLGVPCIVSTHVGCAQDLVVEGRTGWIFQAGDVDALARALEQALDAGQQARAAMAAAAFVRVDGYSYDVATAALLDTVRTVLGNHPLPPTSGHHVRTDDE